MRRRSCRAPRNAGLDAATGDWCVVLDADEMIRNPAQLRKYIAHAPDDVHAFNILFENYVDNHVTLRWYQVRAFRRNLYRYRYREHELPMWCGDGAPNEPVTDIVFEHRAPAQRGPAKLTPMLERLRLDVEEHPDDPHPLYFLHRQYVLAGEWQAALEHGRRYLEHPGALDKTECLGNMASAHLALELAPSFWWQWEPEESAAGVGTLIDECQQYLARK